MAYKTQFSEKLVKNALLGSERLPFQIDILPPALQDILQNADKSDSEALLLKAISLSVTYDKAGQQATLLETENLKLAESEFLPYCSPLAISVWKKMQVWSVKHPFLVEIFLDKMMENKWLLTPDLIVALLQLGATKKGEHLREKIAFVVGNRGVWLTQFYPKWAYILPSDDVKTFHEGKSAERLTALRRIRRTDPALARNLLSETWKTESPKEKRAFLEAFSIHFSVEDAAFVAQCKADIAYQEREPTLSVFQANGQIEQVLMEHKTLIYNAEWQSLPLYFAWSKAFSEFMLKATYESFQYVNFTRGAALQPWFAHLHPAVLLDHIPNIHDRYEQKYQWAEFCAREMSKVMEIRKMIAL